MFSSSTLKWIGVIALFILIMNWRDVGAWVAGPVSYDADAAGPVTLYSTAWCRYCTKTRRFLNRNQIPFTEIDVEKSEQGRLEFSALGGRGVPVVRVGERILHGYDPGGLRRALELTGDGR